MSYFFENSIHSANYYFKYALGNSALKGEEFHEHDEIVFFLGGKAKFVSKNIQLDLLPKSLIFIPRESFHQFVYENEEEYLRCIFHFRGQGDVARLWRDTVGEIRIINEPTAFTEQIFDMLIKVSQEKNAYTDKEALLSSAFFELLLERKIYGWNDSAIAHAPSPLIKSTLDFVDKHYAENIRIEDIAKHQKVSPSLLSHRFKRELSISVHKYIIEKRLSAVRELVRCGASLTTAAASCGFADYSSFFRLYKRQNGTSPSKKQSHK